MSNYIKKFKAGLCVVEVPKECFGEFLYFAEKYFGYDFERAQYDWEWIKNEDKCMVLLVNEKITPFIRFETLSDFIKSAKSRHDRGYIGCQYKELKNEIEQMEKEELDDIFDIDTYGYLDEGCGSKSAYYLSWDENVHWTAEVQAIRYSCGNYGAAYKTKEDAKVARRWFRYVNTLLYFKRKYDSEDEEAHWVVKYVRPSYDSDCHFAILYTDFEETHEEVPAYFKSREAAKRCCKYLNRWFKEW